MTLSLCRNLMFRCISKTLLVCLAVPLLGACGVAGDSLEGIKSTLNSRLGGYRLDEELPAFGRSDLEGALAATAPRPAEIPAMGFAEPAHPPTGEGVLAGFWSDYDKGFGVLAGRWTDASGGVGGYLKAVYGYSELYRDWIFLGKLIDHQGRGLGLLSGRFYQGSFQGTWVDEDEVVQGTVEGAVGGPRRFSGRWRAHIPPPKTGPGEIPWHLLR